MAFAKYCDDSDKGFKEVLSAYAEFSILPSKLSFKISYNLDYSQWDQQNYTPESYVGGSQGTSVSVLSTFVQKLLDAGAEVNNALTQWQSAQKKSGTQRPQSRSAPNGRAQHHPADGTRQHKLSGSAHGPPDAPAGTTVRTIRQIRRNSGHHQPLPRPRRRSRITTVKTYFITTKN